MVLCCDCHLFSSTSISCKKKTVKISKHSLMATGQRNQVGRLLTISFSGSSGTFLAVVRSTSSPRAPVATFLCSKANMLFGDEKKRMQ